MKDERLKETSMEERLKAKHLVDTSAKWKAARKLGPKRENLMAASK